MNNRNIVLVIGMVLLLGLSLAAVVRADDEGPSPGAICHATGDNPFSLPFTISHSNCVNCVNAFLSGGADAAGPCVCKAAIAAGAISPDQYGECVAEVSSSGVTLGPSTMSLGVFSILLAAWAGIQFRQRRKGVYS